MINLRKRLNLNQALRIRNLAHYCNKAHGHPEGMALHHHRIRNTREIRQR